MRSNKYLEKMNVINNNLKLADTLDNIKCTRMIKTNPRYPSTIYLKDKKDPDNTNFTNDKE